VAAFAQTLAMSPSGHGAVVVVVFVLDIYKFFEGSEIFVC
jgi:hypothetical protein